MAALKLLSPIHLMWKFEIKVTLQGVDQEMLLRSAIFPYCETSTERGTLCTSSLRCI